MRVNEEHEFFFIQRFGFLVGRHTIRGCLPRRRLSQNLQIPFRQSNTIKADGKKKLA